MSQVRQVCSSWSSHVDSWTLSTEIKVFIMRYEDMHAKPLTTFTKALTFLQYDVDKKSVLQALERSRFAKLQQDEQAHGFRESAAPSKPFFRKGIVGDWENTLTERQVQQMVSHHGVVMRRFGYLDDQNNPIRYQAKERTNDFINS
jgi:hypothetical protein